MYTRRRPRYSARKHTEPVFGRERTVPPGLASPDVQRTRAHGHPATSLRHGEGEEETGNEEEKERRGGSQRSVEASELSGTFRGFATTRERPIPFSTSLREFFFLFFFIFLCCSSIVYSIDIYYYLLATNLIRYLSIRFADRDGTVSDSSGNIVFFSRCDFAAMLRCHPCRSQTPDPCAALNERSSSLCPFLGRFGTVIRRGKGGRWGSRRACADGCCTPLTPPFHRNRSKPRCPSVCLIEI